MTDANFETIQLRREGAHLIITLHRPDRMNAFTPQMKDDLIAAFDLADMDDAVRSVIITGSGRAFCAGADLGAGAETFDYVKRADRQTDDAALRRDNGGLLTLRIFKSKKPVIGAINGAAVGIGATMTLPMDVRIACESAKFGFVFARRGIVPEAASSWFLPRLVGMPTALDWCFSGRVFDAVEAMEKGLAQAVVKAEDLLQAALERADAMTAHSAPVSIAMTRAMLWRMAGATHPMEAHRWDSRAVFARGQMGDAKEGVMSFLEKRTADFIDSVARDYPRFSPFEDDPDYF
jgi:enoyl-CoA hydratase/carnithine racemase